MHQARILVCAFIKTACPQWRAGESQKAGALVPALRKIAQCIRDALKWVSKVYQARCSEIGASKEAKTAPDRATLRNRLYLGGIIASIVFHGGLLTHLLMNGRLPSSVPAEKEAPAIVIEVIEARAFERMLSQRASEAAPALSSLALSAEARVSEEEEYPASDGSTSGDMIGNIARTTAAVSDSERHALSAAQNRGNMEQPSELQFTRNVQAMPPSFERMTEKPDSIFMPNFRSAQDLEADLTVVDQYEGVPADRTGSASPKFAALSEADHWKAVGEVSSQGMDASAVPVPVPRPSISFLSQPSATSGQSASPNSSMRRSRSGVSREARLAYRQRVKSHLERHKPFGGLGKGNVSVAVSLSRNGDLLSAEITGSSGNTELEQAVLDAVHNAAPFPHPPVSIGQPKISYVIPYRFE